MELLFVYGTLLSGMGHAMGAKLRQSASFKGVGNAYGMLYDIGEYPGFLPVAEKGLIVVGEVYDLSNCTDLLAELDAYEGVGESDNVTAEYTREKARVITADATISCWTYVYQGPVQYLTPIRDGDYLAYYLTKNQ